MSIESPYYWIGVLALAALFAIAATLVGNERFDLPFYRLAIALYVAPWIALGTLTAGPLYFGSLNVDPHWPPLWTGLPVALTAGVLVILGSGHGIAWLFGARRSLFHPRHLWNAWKSRPHERRPALTQEQLRAAETYDAAWQIEDKKRNRRLGTGPRL